MKEKLHRYFSCLMAVVLLFSTTSWKVEKHYCMGHLVDVAFFVDAHDCGMDMSFGSELEASKEKKSCCDLEVIAVEGQSDAKPSFNDFDLEHHSFLVAFTYSYIGLFEPLTAQGVPHSRYIPPKIVKDIQLLDDVFLI